MNTRYKWKPGGLLRGILAFFLPAALADFLIYLTSPRQQAAGVILVMVGMVIACMITERGKWKIWQRILFVPASWILQAVFQLPAALIGGLIYVLWPPLAEGAIAFLASLPVVLFAMRQSRLFVEKVENSEGE